MKQVKLEELTVDELLERFAEIGVAQDKAELMGEISKYNSLYSQMDDVDQELRKRGTSARLALLRLYSHPNIQVRLKAAIRTLAIAPDAARSAIGDNGEDQRLIRTFLRKGVRFVGQVREMQTSGDARTPRPEGPADGPTGAPSAAPKQAVTCRRTKDGVNLAVASVGNGPVLLRAAHWGTHIEYDLQNPLTGPLLQRLAGHFHLVRYDGRGTGLSDWSVGEISFETFLDDLKPSSTRSGSSVSYCWGCTAVPQCRSLMRCGTRSACQSWCFLAAMRKAIINGARRATPNGRRQ